MEPEYIGSKIAALRHTKNVSAREMSLALGQSQSYINKIENKISMPSMEMFLVICDFLDVTPAEFFDVENENPVQIKDLVSQAKKLDTDSLRHIQALITKLIRR